MQGQRKFIERNMITGDNTRKRVYFGAWKEAMDIIRVENQLEKQIKSLKKCETVSEQLQQALNRQRESNQQQDSQQQQLETALGELVAANKVLEKDCNKQTALIESLQRQLQLAVDGLDSTKGNLLTMSKDIDRAQGEVKKEAPKGLTTSPSKIVEARPRGNDYGTIDESIQIRNESQNVMDSVSGLLKYSRDNAPQPGRQQSANVYGDGQGYVSSQIIGSRGLRKA